LAVAGGDLPRAIMLYERAWRFADVLPLALAIGDRPRAIRLALDAGDTASAAAIAETISRDAPLEIRAAAASFAARGSHWQAARMAERAGNHALAAEYFRRAGNLLDVGRMEELADRPREAGIAYEQALAAATRPEDAAVAHLALGRLLARLGRHQDAARALQQAIRGPAPAVRLAAGRTLTSQFVALGLRFAAAEIVRRLRRQWPDLPDSVEAIAALDAADIWAGSSTVGQVVSPPGLLRNRFRVRRTLGAGATSSVYLADDTLLDQPVALKLLTVGTNTHGAERQAYLQFTREAEAAGRLSHPNIVALHDADPAMGLFVLEFMSGGTLADRLSDQEVLSPLVVRRLALDLLAALGAAHDAGIVHRDVKPANVLFDAGGNAKLGDFGAAHLADFGQTQTIGLLGTVAYMSPEQISGGTIGPAADLYALAVTLFEALTGRLPFPGPDIVAQHLSEEPPRPSTCVESTKASWSTTATSTGTGTGTTAGAAQVTEAHDHVLLRALRKAPSERWASAAQMADAIRSWPTQFFDAAPLARAEATQVFARPPARESGRPMEALPDVPLGRSRAGQLFCRADSTLGRPVVVEIRDQPVVDGALDRLRALAAAGGPQVQRVLALSDDGRTVTYELCEGPRVSPSDLSAEDAAAVARALDAVDAASGEASPQAPRGIILMPGGPVVLVVEPGTETT
jgi:serine/threonine-protein kinase